LASRHACNGCNACDNRFKLPPMCLMMLVALLLPGPGRVSLDHRLRQMITKNNGA